MLKTIDFYLPERSQYNVLHGFTVKLYEAFVRKGFTCRLIPNAQIISLARVSPADLSISFNGAPQITPGVFLCDIVERPHLTWLMDLPYHYLGLIESPFMTIACDDQYGCLFLHQLGFYRTFFLPQAVDSEAFCSPEVKRDLGLVFFASFLDSEAELSLIPESVKNFFRLSAARCFVERDKPFIEILMDQYQKKMEIQAYDLLPLFSRFEKYVKALAREKLVLELAEYDLTLFDERWISFLPKNSKIKVRPSLSFEETFQVMQRAKIVVNNSIRSPLGGSERVVNAMLCGAVAVTNENPFMRHQFIDQVDLVLYRAHEFEKTKLWLNKLLENEVARSQMAHNGQEKALENHTWESRVDQILTQLGKISFVINKY